MPQTFIISQAGNWIIEDDGEPGNNRSRIRNLDTGTFQDFPHAADSITFLASVSGVNLTIDFLDDLGAASFTVGDLDDGSLSPSNIIIRNVETTGRVTLVANGGIGEGSDADAAADIIAGELVLSAFSGGIGTPANALETQVSRLEAETEFEGINLSNTGTVTIGGLVGLVSGLHGSPTSRDVTLVNAGSIVLDFSDPGSLFQTVSCGRFGTVTLIANGYESDIYSIADHDAVVSGGPVLLRAGRDISFGVGGLDNLVLGEGSVSVEAGRDVILDGDNGGYGAFSTAFGGSVSVTAGRNITFSGAGGVLGRDEARFTTGQGGTLALNGYGFIQSFGNIFLNADRMLISPSFTLYAEQGTATLAGASAGRAIVLGSASDSATALELSDAELDRVVAGGLIVGGNDSGRVTLVGAVNPANVGDIEVRSGSNIELRGSIVTPGSLTLRALDNVLQYATGIIDVLGSLTVLVDAVDDDPGTGGIASLTPAVTANPITISGNVDGDRLTGTDVSDDIFGLGGNDILRGLAGADTLTGGPGADALDGGPDTDAADYSDNFGGVSVNLATGVGQFNFAHGDTYTSIENVIGTEYGDILTGNAGVNFLVGNGGNDTIMGGAGADNLNGGAGVDTLTYAGNFGGVSIDLQSGAGLFNFAQGDFVLGFENVIGTEFADILRGDGGNNRLEGNGQNDQLAGRTGNDVLDGGLGADALDGGLDVDTADYAGEFGAVFINLAMGTGLWNAAQGDTLTAIEKVIGTSFGDRFEGNNLANVFTGGAGNDEFIFNAGFSQDAITDFAGNGAAAGDTVRFAAGLFANFADMISKSAQVGSDVVITLNASNTLTLQGVTLASLDSSDFFYA